MRNLEKIKERLEQKARIDISQVRQREKELESKLELMAMDVDSQVHSRDQKILELRRKIDALEFNMENASIKEQKSLEDKRKLEDRLSKIMKTLRHSIKNLEDDIDHVEEDDDHQTEKN
jgi:chromosome segregation ATPase